MAERQKADLRDWVAQHQAMFESLYTDMLLRRPVDPKAFLIGKFEALLNDNDSGDGGGGGGGDDDTPEPNVTKDDSAYADDMREYMQATQKYFEDVFTTLLLNKPDDPRAFMIRILQGEVPLTTVGGGGGGDDEAPPAELEKMDVSDVPNRYRSRNRRAAVSAEADDDGEEYVARVIPKDDEAKGRIKAAVSQSFLFGSLDTDQLDQVVDSMAEKRVANGEVVIQEGAEGDNFYIIDNGTFDVLKKIDDVEKKVFFYENKGSFGELALMYNTPRAATIKATSDGLLWAVDRSTFRHIIIAATRGQRESYEKFLQHVSLFENLTGAERSLIADCLVPAEYKHDEVIIRQGDEGDKFYLIEKGGAVAVQTHDGAEVEVGSMHEGQFFGERALLTNDPRAATVKAVGKCKVAAMARDAFERLLGDCKDVMHRQMKHYPSAQEILSKQDE